MASIKMSLSEENALINQALQGQETLAAAISAIGYAITKEGRNLKFKRRDENTPSCQINSDGTWHDYGDGDHGDWAKLYIEKNNCDFRTAVKEGLKRFGINVDTGTAALLPVAPIFRPYETERKNVQVNPLNPGMVNWFLRQSEAHKGRYTELCRRLMPFAGPSELHRAQRLFKIGYDPKTDRLTIPVHNIRGEIVNLFKYTPYAPYEMWKYRMQCKKVRFKASPKWDCVSLFNPQNQLKVRYLFDRPRFLFNLQVLKYKPKILYILEGEKDTVNATVVKKAAITQGGANMWREQFTKDLLEACIFYGVDPSELQIVIVQDHDKPGVSSTLKIYKGLKDAFPNVVMAFWKEETAKAVKMTKKFKEIEPHGRVGILDVKLDPVKVGLKFDYTDYQMVRHGRL